MQDDVILGIGDAGDDAAGRNLGVIVPGFPQHHGFFRLFHKGQRVVTLHSLELVGAGVSNDIAVGAAHGIQVNDIVAERVVVMCQFIRNVAEIHHGTAADFHYAGVLVNLGVFAVFLELESKAVERSAVGQIDENITSFQAFLNLQHRVSLVLGIELFLVGELHLQELIAQGLLLGGREQVALIFSLNGEAQDAADALELESVPAVAGRHDLLVRRGELAVEEAVFEIVHGRCRVSGIQRAGTVFANVRIQARHSQCRRLSIGRYVAGGEGDGNLVLGILAVHHNLVSGFPGGLEGRRSLFALLQVDGREDEGERAGLGLGFGLHGSGFILLAAGYGQRQDAKDRNFIDCLHNQMHLKVL